MLRNGCVESLALFFWNGFGGITRRDGTPR
jgi:hypothetical protein